MSIKQFIAAILTGVFAISLACIAVAAVFLEDTIGPLLVGIEENQALATLVLETSLTSLFLVILLVSLLFYALGKYIALPIRMVTTAMQSFAQTGQKPGPLTLGWAPHEVRSLAEEFTKFTENVDEVHKHDTEISRVKSDFISTAAHQLRTPLTGIRWALEALQMEQLTENQKTLVASAVEKSHQLVAVVGTLLDISSIESGKYKYDLKLTELDQIVGEVTRDFEPLAITSKVSLLFEKSGEASALVSVDRERIRWVLNNIVENAIRYTPAGGAVRVTTELAPGRVYVKVHDTGIGIAQVDKGNIFERFYRAPNAIAKENGGNGLGLYIARTIATDHGGDLNFETNKGGPGTTFTLSLPLAG
ncbi:MAG: HAMP domain-containing sensor histidine kinase [Rectinemataceae bacterium]|nr:HAMP domain-containing sensor histidine kinase [Rectinemataceae bacterium]